MCVEHRRGTRRRKKGRRWCNGGYIDKRQHSIGTATDGAAVGAEEQPWHGGERQGAAMAWGRVSRSSHSTSSVAGCCCGDRSSNHAGADVGEQRRPCLAAVCKEASACWRHAEVFQSCTNGVVLVGCLLIRPCLFLFDNYCSIMD